MKFIKDMNELSAVAGHGRMNISAVAEGIMGRLIQCFNNTEHVQGLGANGKAAFSPKAHG